MLSGPDLIDRDQTQLSQPDPLLWVWVINGSACLTRLLNELGVGLKFNPIMTHLFETYKILQKLEVEIVDAMIFFEGSGCYDFHLML